MWHRIKNWFIEKKAYLFTLLLVSIAAGLIFAGACFFFPALLLAISSFAIFGLSPFAFLATIHLPVALITLVAFTSGITFSVFVASTLLIEQLITISTHVIALFDKNEEYDYSTPGSPYVNSHLRRIPSDSFDEGEEEEFFEVDEFSSSEQAEEPEHSESSDYPEVIEPATIVPR